jgi:hypothetical protein
MLDAIDPSLLLHASTDHPSEWSDEQLSANVSKLHSLLLTHADDLATLLEVYVDDYIGAIQTDNIEILRHASRALMHGIHSVFSPPALTGHNGGDPISVKKLLAGDGVWAVRKEILGWIFDGLVCTIELPPDKIDKILSLLTTSIQKGHLARTAFRSLLGKLQNAALAVPVGRSILTPLHKFVEITDQPVLYFKNRPLIVQALRDMRVLIQEMTSLPTNVRELVPHMPSYFGFCDASGKGAGGVWIGGPKNLHPIVWRLEWPQDIQIRLVSSRNPHGDLTINDLECAGLLLQYLVLEQYVDLTSEHVAAWCDNASTVSWVRRATSSRSLVGQRLIRALMLRLRANRASPLVALSIQGIKNIMADAASRSFATSRTLDNNSRHPTHNSSPTLTLPFHLRRTSPGGYSN